MIENNNNKTEDKTLINELEINFDVNEQSKDNFVKTELVRLQKENVSLRMELNFIYEQMKEDNKIFELKEGGGIIAKRSSKDFSNEKKRKSLNTLQSANNSNNASNNNYSQPVGQNQKPVYLYKLKNENIEDIYVHFKNIINRLRLSEFHL